MIDEPLFVDPFSLDIIFDHRHQVCSLGNNQQSPTTLGIHHLILVVLLNTVVAQGISIDFPQFQWLINIINHQSQTISNH